MTRLRGITGIATCLIAGWTAPASADAVTEWNALALGCITRPGPTGLLDLALVQAAVHDAVQAIEGKYEPYLATPAATGKESIGAAAAAAAYTVLSDSRICPDSAQPTLDTAFAPYLAGNDAGLDGRLCGRQQVAHCLSPCRHAHVYRQERNRPMAPDATRKRHDGVPLAQGRRAVRDDEAVAVSPRPAADAGQPPVPARVQRGQGKGVDPEPSDDGRCPAPADTDLARFWAGNFVAQWNQVARDIALDRQLSLGDTARLLALINFAAADAGIAIWDAKVYYNFWRPITAIQQGDADPNSRTVGDPNWHPFIESLSHFQPAGAAQKPAYPDYVSGANGLTGAFTATLQLFFGTDWVPFEVYKAPAAATVPICTNPRTYRRISDAAQEVVDARIFLGIHFRSADEEARRLGTRVAFWTFFAKLRPTYKSH